MKQKPVRRAKSPVRVTHVPAAVRQWYSQIGSVKSAKKSASSRANAAKATAASIAARKVRRLVRESAERKARAKK